MSQPATARTNRAAEIAELQAELARVKAVEQEVMRRGKVMEAREHLVPFTEITMPAPGGDNDPLKSRYDTKDFHRGLANELEAVERGETQRLIICFPPRHGKTEMASNRFIAWCIGRDPYRNIIFGTYNQPFADVRGRKIRSIIQDPTYKDIFPNLGLKKGEQASDHLMTEEDGELIFVGRGGSATGRGADILVIDDPHKDRKEASSQTIRDDVWAWFNDTIETRLMSDTGAIVIIMCMTGDTPVLMANGTEKPLRDIRRGDRVATYENGKVVISTVRNWANQGPDRVFTIKMKSGKSVRANARHPFLVYEDGVEKWLQTDLLKKGSVILTAIGGNGRGKNALSKGAISPPSARACACLTTIGHGGKAASAPLRSMLDLAVNVAFATATALISPLMSACLPIKVGFAQSADSHQQLKIPARIGAENSASIIAMIAGGFADFFATTAILPSATGKLKPSCKPLLDTFEIGHDTVVEIVESGIEDVFDIQVDRTENFIANGLVSHNTRWHEDDLVGRLTDENNPHYKLAEAEQWKIINIRAIAEDDDVLGRPIGAALWPEKFGIEWLKRKMAKNPLGFSALYQQRPTPADGDNFTAAMLDVGYDSLSDLPQNLRWYIASDHVTGSKQGHDLNVIMVVGVDFRNRIWIHPDLFWQRCKTDVMVEEMLKFMQRYKPLLWWAGKDHISGSIEPFLRKRMRETNTYIHLVEQSEKGDKLAKAQPAIGRCAMGMVMWPKFATWYGKARSHFLKFPNGNFDDIVDALSHICRGLERQVGGSIPEEEKPDLTRVIGSIAWIKSRTKYDEEAKKIERALRSA